MFEVQFYDGSSSSKKKAFLKRVETGWLIQCEDDEIFWSFSEVQPGKSAKSGTLFHREINGVKQTILSDTPLPTDFLPAQEHRNKPRKTAAIFGNRNLIFFGLPVLCLLIATLVYIYLLPFFIDSFVFFVPESLEIQLGDIAAESIEKSFEESVALTQAVEQFSANLDYGTDRAISVKVVEEDILNAFCLPNGRIIIFRKLLEKLQSPGELAALLGHEVAHVKNRDALRSIVNKLFHSLILSLIFGDLTSVSAFFAENTAILLDQKYSRENETKADLGALEILEANSFGKDSLLNLMERIRSENDTRESPIGEWQRYYDSHPSGDERIAAIKKAGLAERQAKPKKELLEIWRKIQKEIEQEE